MKAGIPYLRLYKTIEEKIEERYGQQSIVTWQDSLPYNEESKATVVELVRETEIELGLRDAT